ncbi:hypothetical protein CEXT_162041 [Caerostris extrusa]|uniref:Uncharacterized protein n=1 Tax=Caerostris extrusa TaxID=172846 RepID=A0AAV4NS32_CAEEX|nr:hypothetical protein CEXT_162041 [Caerostris extrusa]
MFMTTYQNRTRAYKLEERFCPAISAKSWRMKCFLNAAFLVSENAKSNLLPQLLWRNRGGSAPTGFSHAKSPSSK